MCEYCGCQQIAAIGELTREHDAVVALIGQIRSALVGQHEDQSEHRPVAHVTFTGRPVAA